MFTIVVAALMMITRLQNGLAPAIPTTCMVEGGHNAAAAVNWIAVVATVQVARFAFSGPTVPTAPTLVLPPQSAKAPTESDPTSNVEQPGQHTAPVTFERALHVRVYDTDAPPGAGGEDCDLSESDSEDDGDSVSGDDGIDDDDNGDDPEGDPDNDPNDDLDDDRRRARWVWFWPSKNKYAHRPAPPAVRPPTDVAIYNRPSSLVVWTPPIDYRDPAWMIRGYKGIISMFYPRFIDVHSAFPAAHDYLDPKSFGFFRSPLSFEHEDSSDALNRTNPLLALTVGDTARHPLGAASWVFILLPGLGAVWSVVSWVGRKAYGLCQTLAAYLQPVRARISAASGLCVGKATRGALWAGRFALGSASCTAALVRSAEPHASMVLQRVKGTPALVSGTWASCRLKTAAYLGAVQAQIRSVWRGVTRTVSDLVAHALAWYTWTRRQVAHLVELAGWLSWVVGSLPRRWRRWVRRAGRLPERELKIPGGWQWPVEDTHGPWLRNQLESCREWLFGWDDEEVWLMRAAGLERPPVYRAAWPRLWPTAQGLAELGRRAGGGLVELVTGGLGALVLGPVRLVRFVMEIASGRWQVEDQAEDQANRVELEGGESDAEESEVDDLL